jgi:hypothetical protein
MKTTNNNGLSISRPLVLKEKDIRKNTEELFEHLGRDERARQDFIKNPTAALSEKIVKHKLPEQEVSDVNRVLFAMLANDRFRKWLDEYEASPGGKKVSEAEFSKDFANAVLQFGDSDLIRALFKQAGDGFGLQGFSKVAEQLFTGPEKSTVTSPATPSTSDKSAKSSQNFNNSSSGLQLGLGGIVDPALVRAVISQLIEHAKQLQASGALRV